MANYSENSSSYNTLTSSESDNEIRNYIELGNIKKYSSNKTVLPFKTSLSSNLSPSTSKTSKNSLKYFKKLKRKNNSKKSRVLLKKSYLNSPYLLKQPRTKNKTIDRNTSNYDKQNHNFTKRKSKFSKSNLNKEFTNDLESSSDSDIYDVKYLKMISKNSEITSSITNKKSMNNNSKLNKASMKQSTYSVETYNKNIECSNSSITSNSFDFSQTNLDSIHVSELDSYDMLSDSSLPNVLLFRKDNDNKINSIYPTPDSNNSFLLINSGSSPKSLPFNTSLGVHEELLLQKPSSNFIINSPGLINTENEKKEKTFENEMKVDESERVSNRNEFSELKSKSDSFETTEENINFSELDSNQNKCICNSKNNTNKISSKKKTKKSNEKNKSKSSNSITSTNNPNVLLIKKSFKLKKERYFHSKNQTEDIIDIGLEYDSYKDNHMVELGNGVLVPAFLSTLKVKNLRKLCACGISTSEIPFSWSESFHDVLHQNIHKLRFNGNLSKDNIINDDQNNFMYMIVALNKNEFNDENFKNTIKNIDDFVSLEYGISKRSVKLCTHSIYLAVLPNLKVIGYLEVIPIRNAYKLSHDGQPLEETVIVKFGVSKIWVFIKYRNKNVDNVLLEHFRAKEKLEKEDIAFSLEGCQNVEYIEKCLEDKNILIFKECYASYD